METEMNPGRRRKILWGAAIILCSLLIAGSSIFIYLKVTLSKNEASAQERLRAVIVGQRQFFISSPNGSYASKIEHLTIPSVGCHEQIPPVRDHGYIFRVIGLEPLKLASDETPVFLRWCAVASPVRYGLSGRTVFLVDDQVDPLAEELPHKDFGKPIDLEGMNDQEVLDFLKTTWPEHVTPFSGKAAS